MSKKNQEVMTAADFVACWLEFGGEPIVQAPSEELMFGFQPWLEPKATKVAKPAKPTVPTHVVTVRYLLRSGRIGEFTRAMPGATEVEALEAAHQWVWSARARNGRDIKGFESGWWPKA